MANYFQRERREERVKAEIVAVKKEDKIRNSFRKKSIL